MGMHQIVADMKDPAWWFTAVFIGIVVSVFAGFAKERIELMFGALSGRFRARQIEKAKRRDSVVNALAENEGFLILAMVRVTGQLVYAIS
jgi:hypothetical protein